MNIESEKQNILRLFPGPATSVENTAQLFKDNKLSGGIIRTQIHRGREKHNYWGSKIVAWVHLPIIDDNVLIEDRIDRAEKKRLSKVAERGSFSSKRIPFNQAFPYFAQQKENSSPIDLAKAKTFPEWCDRGFFVLSGRLAGKSWPETDLQRNPLTVFPRDGKVDVLLMNDLVSELKNEVSQNTFWTLVD